MKNLLMTALILGLPSTSLAVEVSDFFGEYTKVNCPIDINAEQGSTNRIANALTENVNGVTLQTVRQANATVLEIRGGLVGGPSMYSGNIYLAAGTHGQDEVTGFKKITNTNILEISYRVKSGNGLNKALEIHHYTFTKSTDGKVKVTASSSIRGLIWPVGKPMGSAECFLTK